MASLLTPTPDANQLGNLAFGNTPSATQVQNASLGFGAALPSIGALPASNFGFGGPTVRGEGLLTPGGITPQSSNPFGAPTPLDPNAVAAGVRDQFVTQVPKVTAPVATPAQVELPGGTFDALQKNLYNAQFGPVQQEVAREKAQADTALSGQLAQAGLADSGSGVGQRELQSENYDTYLQNVSQNISASATATALQAEIGVASENAQLQQQTRLANAGFDLTAQQTNAANVLNGDMAAAQAYLTAIGLNEQQATAYRAQAIQFYGLQQEGALARDKLALEAQGQLMNFALQSAALAQRSGQLAAAQNAQAYRNASGGSVPQHVAAASQVIGGALGGNPSDQPMPPSPLGPYNNAIDPNTGLPIGGSALDRQGYGVGVQGQGLDLGIGGPAAPGIMQGAPAPDSGFPAAQGEANPYTGGPGYDVGGGMFGDSGGFVGGA